MDPANYYSSVLNVHVSIPPHLSCYDCPSWRHRGLADSGCRIIINRTWCAHGTLPSLFSERIKTWSVHDTLSSLFSERIQTWSVHDTLSSLFSERIRTWSVHGTLSSLLSGRIQTWSVHGTLSSLLSERILKHLPQRQDNSASQFARPSRRARSEFFKHRCIRSTLPLCCG